MKRYWIRIALTACGIFVLGMVVVSAARRGVDHVKQAIDQQSFSFIPGEAPFQVDSHRLGTLTRVEVDPDLSQRFPFINLTVALDSTASTAALGGCTLVADGESPNGAGLRCVAGLSPDSLVQMGDVTFEPGGEVVAIFLPSNQLPEIPWFRPAAGNHAAPPAPSESMSLAAMSESSLSLTATAAGALMLIKDDKGRPVFQLSADSQGAFIQIRDSNGKEVVRFRADSQGIKGRIDH
jgi:hypothetical protein